VETDALQLPASAREREAPLLHRIKMVAMQLLALAQPAAQHLGTLLDDDVAGQQALVDRSFRLPPQRLSDGSDEIGGLGYRHSFGQPRGTVQGVPDEKQQPGDIDLRLDVDLDVTDPGRADLPGWPNLPSTWAIGRMVPQ
jgi:hypothetical protein